MNGLNLYEYPAPELRMMAKPVDPVRQPIGDLAKEMLQLMYRSEGIGLAAPQVGQLIQLMVLDVSEQRNEPLVFVNPVIEARSGRVKSVEGCLSLPGISVEVERSEIVTLSALTLDGEAQTHQAQGLQAICIQHELDHLFGRVLLDYLSDFRKRLMLKKYEKLQRRRRQHAKN